MINAKILSKETINQDESRFFDPEIQDTLMLTFEVKILMDKDDVLKKFHIEQFENGQSNAYVTCLFRELFMTDQKLEFSHRKYTRKLPKH